MVKALQREILKQNCFLATYGLDSTKLLDCDCGGILRGPF